MSNVDPLSNDEAAFYSTSGDSRVRTVDAKDDATLALSGVVIDTIENVATGPTKDQRNVHNPIQRLALRQAEMIHPTEIISSLIFKMLSRRYPKLKKIVGGAKQELPNPEETKDDHQLAESLPEEGMARLFKRAADWLAESSKFIDPDHGDIFERRGLELFYGFIKDTRRLRQVWGWGPVHTTNDIYMMPKLEAEWQQLM